VGDDNAHSIIPRTALKILLVSVHPPYGGGSAHSSMELATGLRSLGHEVLHVAPYNTGQEDNLAHYQGLHWIKADFPWNTLTITPAAQASMDADLKVAYEKHGPFDYVILGRETFVWHIPAIKEVHKGPIMLVVRGAYINRLAGNTNETIDPVLRAQLVGLYRQADVIVCIAKHLVSAINRVIFNDESDDKTIFIPNPIKLPVFDESQLNMPLGDKIRIVMAAQIKARKRPLDAVEIMRELRDMGRDAELIVFGSGPDRDEMDALIRRYGLGDRIQMRGHVKKGEVLRTLAEVETVLLCSDNEGWPRTLQEAIAAGKGIVAYDNIGSREVLTEWLGQAWPLGRLVPIGDVKGAAKAIVELADLMRSAASSDNNNNNSNGLVLPKLKLPSSLEVLQEWEMALRRL